MRFIVLYSQFLNNRETVVCAETTPAGGIKLGVSAGRNNCGEAADAALRG